MVDTSNNRIITDIDGEEYRVVDGDTDVDSKGNAYRYGGFNTREQAQVKQDKYGEDRFVLPDKGAYLQAEIRQKVIEDGNFNRVVKTGEFDKYGREIIDRLDPSGRSLNETMIANGLAEVNRYTSESALAAKQAQEANRQLTGEQGKYADLERQINASFNEHGLMEKGAALNEALYDPNYHSSVMFRDHDRDLANNQIGFWSQAGSSFGQSWQGIKEGFYGYADALGETFDLETLEDIGENGIARARAKMNDAPSIVLDYREVDGLMKGFQYVMNNAAMAAPYMGLTIGAMAAAVPIGGLATVATGSTALGVGIAGVSGLVPNSVIFAGQIWNEFEGERTPMQFVAASVGGISAAVVERFGLSKLLPKTVLLQKSGVEKVARALRKRNNANPLNTKISMAQARQAVVTATRKTQAAYAKTLAKLSADDIVKFSAYGVGKAIGTSALIEAGTEVAQESIQMATAAGFSEKQYDPDDIFNRLLNAGIAGGAIGAGFGGVARGRADLKNYMLKQDLTRVGDQERLDTLARKKVETLNAGEKINSIEENIKQNDAQELRETENLTTATRAEVAGDLENAGKTEEEINQLTREKEEEVKKAKKENTISKLANAYQQNKRGIVNFFTQNNNLYDYGSALATGLANLVRSAERAVIPMTRAIISPEMLDILARIGGSTTGRFHDGDNFRAYQEMIIGKLSGIINRSAIIKLILGEKAKVNSKNIKEVSKRILFFARTGAFKDYRKFLEEYRNNPDAKWNSNKKYGSGKEARAYTKEEADLLFTVSLKFEEAWRGAFEVANAQYNEEMLNTERRDVNLEFDPDGWYKQDTFDYKKVKKNPTKFKAYLRTVLRDDADIDKIYQEIVHRGDSHFGKEYSLIGDRIWLPSSFTREGLDLSSDSRFDEFRSENIFEASSKAHKEAAKYAASTKYFGHKGRKLDFLFNRMITKARLDNNEGINALKLEEIDQASYYIKAIIDSTHGTYNRVESPKMQALNAYLTSWSIMAGLTLATISSIPETAMVFFKVNNDALFKKAVNRFNEQVAGIWDEAAEKEVQRTIKMLDRSGFSDLQNAVVDRFATGQRDVSFLRAHEVFFRTIGIAQFTQFQRRLNAAFAIDYVETNMHTLLLAPTKFVERGVDEDGVVITEEILNFDEMSEFELRTFNYLSDLGIDVQGLLNAFKVTDELYRDHLFRIEQEYAPEERDGIIQPTPRQAALASLVNNRNALTNNEQEIVKDVQAAEEFIDSQLETAIYNFVNERVQNPQAANRPLFFQDPHYQLLTQFNGFISTFTAQVIPQLYRNQMAKGTLQVKYDTFALIVMLMVLGGASQYIKDKIKFGKPSPYLSRRDDSGVSYIQRALYASGVLGQYERVFDAIKPLYPSRDDTLAYTLLGETGPSARNVTNVIGGLIDISKGEGEVGANKVLKTVPIVSTINQLRKATVKGAQGEDPRPYLEFTNPVDDVLSIFR